MNLQEILSLKFPNADFIKHIRLSDHGDGRGIQISYWDEEFLKCSIPTEKQIELWADEIDLAYRIKLVIDKRIQEYPPITEQLDMQYKDAKDGTTIWYDTIKAIKDANPKPME